MSFDPDRRTEDLARYMRAEETRNAAIRERFAAGGVTKTQLAEEHGISRARVGQIIGSGRAGRTATARDRVERAEKRVAALRERYFDERDRRIAAEREAAQLRKLVEARDATIASIRNMAGGTE